MRVSIPGVAAEMLAPDCWDYGLYIYPRIIQMHSCKVYLSVYIKLYKAIINNFRSNFFIICEFRL